MTESDRQATAEQPTVRQPEVSADTTTDRPGSPWYRSGVPAHLGRARTSTVVLSVLFLAIGTLYLNIRPDPPGQAPASDAGTEQPAETTDAPETTTPEETTDPAPTTELEPTTDPEPTTGPTSIPAPTGDPDGTAVPEETADEDSVPTSVPDVPTGTGTAETPG